MPATIPISMQISPPTSSTPYMKLLVWNIDFLHFDECP